MSKKLWEENRSRLSKYKSYIILGLVFIFLIFIAYEYYHRYFFLFRDPAKLKKIIMSYGKYSVLAFFILQITQVVAFFIPGEIIQIAGGYIYGTLLGSILSLLGITTGSIIVYVISNFYGKPLIDKIISNKDLKFFQRILKAGSINFIVFLLYLIPGIPKDVLAYICGVSSITFKNFILYSTLGRIPGILVSAYFGAKIGSGNPITLVVIGVLAVVLFIIGILKGEKIVASIVKCNSSKES
jgi:uncharacterized membrane protein YdjX (TVP38/TMEM64 family)